MTCAGCNASLDGDPWLSRAGQTFHAECLVNWAKASEFTPTQWREMMLRMLEVNKMAVRHANAVFSATGMALRATQTTDPRLRLSPDSQGYSPLYLDAVKATRERITLSDRLSRITPSPQQFSA